MRTALVFNGRWVGITTRAECLAVERSGSCRNTIRCTYKSLSAVHPLRRAADLSRSLATAEGGQEKYEQFFQKFNDTSTNNELRSV